MKRSILNKVRAPASYLGAEWGAVRKTPTGPEVAWALAFPDAYEIGMSHLGLQILYHILNENPKSLAERAFAPRKDMQDALRAERMKLFSLESSRPLDTFDVIGFSLLYELGFTNMIMMLDLGGIPRRAANRSSGPIVIAGGPCTLNPAPIEAFFDALVMGEGEDVIVEINEVVYDGKNSGAKRETIIERLAAIKGVYVPAIHRNDVKKRIVARKVADLDAAPFPTRPVVPSVEATHDRAVVEIARGCPHACRFCHAGFVCRPYRERKPETALRLALETLKNTGYEDITFLSLSAGDYEGLLDLVTTLSAKMGCDRVAVNLPSLRAGSLTQDVVERIRSMRKTGFTIAPEAGSTRLRSVISKNISDAEIIETSRIVFRNGWDLIKLYFMFGLPTETDDDLKELAELVKAIRREGLSAGKRPKINVSLSAFVPKAHTPFQWDGMTDEREIAYRLDLMHYLLKIPGVNLKWSPSFMSLLEGVFARGDERLADAIEKAVDGGASFDAWGEELRPDVWKRAFDECGLDPQAIASRTIPGDDPLPWDRIETGVEKAWLVEERDKALHGATTLGCENDPCPERCGACDGAAKSFKSDPPRFESLPESVREPRENYRRVRIVYRKRDEAAWLGHLDTIRSIHRALHRTGLKFLFTEGFHPKLKMSYGQALPVGIESDVETFDVWAHVSHTVTDVVAAFNGAAPKGLVAVSAVEGEAASGPADEATSEKYLFELYLENDAKSKVISAICRFNDAAELILEKETKSGVKRINLKDAVKKITNNDNGVIEMELIHGSGLGPKAAYEAIFGTPPDDVRIIKTTANGA